MLIGILMAGTGAFLMVQLNKSKIKKATAYAISILFLISGIAAISASLLNKDNLVFASMALGMGVMLIWVSIFNVTKVFTCNQIINGRYCRCNSCSSKGRTYYSPIFSYCMDGKEYEVQSGETYSLDYIKKHYDEGQSYEIFVHPEKHDLYLTKKQVRWSDISCLILGAMFIVAGYVSVFY